MRQSEYTYTGNMPSGNPFLWYFDEGKRTAFSTSRDAAYWSREPKIGDKVTIHKNEWGDVEKVYINGEKVFEKTARTEEIKRNDEQRRTDAIITNWKKQ